MESRYGQMVKVRIAERDAEAALRTLTRDEKDSLIRVRGGEVMVPPEHQTRLCDLCLAVIQDGTLALTELGMRAADRARGVMAPSLVEADPEW